MEGSGYVSPRSAGTLAIALLGVMIGLDVIIAIACYGQYDLLLRIASHTDFTHEEVTLNDSRLSLLNGVYMVAHLVSAVTFLRWFRCVHKNLGAFGVALSGGLESPILAFVIPIVSLFRPYQIANAIWDASVPVAERLMGRSRAIIGWWWGFWICDNLVSRGSAMAVRFAKDDAAALASATGVSIVENGIDIIAAVLAILVIRGIDERQQDCAGGEIAAQFD